MKLVGSLRQPPRFDAGCGLDPSTVCSSDTYSLLRIVWFACDGLFKSLPIRVGHSCR